MIHNIKWFDSIDSTNSEAIRSFQNSEDFSIFAAKYQTSGRGQKGTVWESDQEKNLTFSIILKSNNIKAENQFYVAQIVTIGIKRYLKSLGIDAKIKWPNDIYVGDKKICGILIEHFLSGDILSGTVVGIGLNLNQTKFNSNAPNPISIASILGKELDLDVELNNLLGYIHEIYYLFLNYRSSSMFSRLDAEYHDSLYRLEEYHQYQETPSGEIITARIMGVDSKACLLLEQENGQTKSYHFKEIKYIL